ncbi:hypothetical protein AK830_g196 [Neonectria ditissima]|uniref:Acyl-CoA dehydrogenase C-terminal domain-containing protein n=1 Tax=Neonectria ditissima TaxID=78410 RepID=A0A0P7C3S9_9HYPO|nr:hypothetical protein AK830_g196 [Neonectria ditissima]
MQNFQAEQARAEASKRWAAEPKPDTPSGWVKRAAEAAEVLKLDAVDRDAASKPPFIEVQLLKDAGLVNLLGPRDFGGGGETWQTSYKVTTEIAKADGSIGHLIGNHYSWYDSHLDLIPFWSSQILGTPLQARRWLREFTEGNYYLGGAVNPRNADMVARDVGDALVFNGDKFFSTGMWWLRHSQYAYHDFILPPVQLQFAAVHLGVGIGALEAAAEYTRTKTRAWPYGGDDKEKATDEWYIREGYGRLQATLWAAEALVDRTAERISKLIHAPREDLTQQARGEIAVQVAASKATAIEATITVSSKLFELTGASSSLSKYGFDRFWRNTRVHSLHDPIAYKFREVGGWALLGEVPEPSWYT